MPRTPNVELERRDLEQHCAAFITKVPAPFGMCINVPVRASCLHGRP
jgi:hypothetical protein